MAASAVVGKRKAGVADERERSAGLFARTGGRVERLPLTRLGRWSENSRLARASRPVVMPAAAVALKRARRAVNSVEDAVDLAYHFRFAGISLAPQQVRSEITGLLRRVEHEKPQTVLELGTARGATIFLFSHVAHSDARIVTVDVGSAAWRSLFYRSFAAGRQEVRLVRGNSHHPVTVARVRELLDSRNVDFLFIDGDHSYEGVKGDFETYSPLVRSGGLIALHDIVPGPEELVGGVPRFWQELKRDLPAVEIVEDWGQGGFGIGVITYPSRRS